MRGLYGRVARQYTLIRGLRGVCRPLSSVQGWPVWGPLERCFQGTKPGKSSPAAARQYLPALIGGGDREVPHEYRCSERDGDPGNVDIDIAPLPSAPVQAVHHVAIETVLRLQRDRGAVMYVEGVRSAGGGMVVTGRQVGARPDRLSTIAATCDCVSDAFHGQSCAAPANATATHPLGGADVDAGPHTHRVTVAEGNREQH